MKYTICEMYFNDGKIKIRRVGKCDESNMTKEGSNSKFDWYFYFFDTEKEMEDYISRAKIDQGSCLIVV